MRVLKSLPATSKKVFIVGAALSLTACGQLPGASVPMQSGSNVTSARAAINSCVPNAKRSGQTAVTSSYVAGVVLGGIIVGPIVVASNQESIRRSGEFNGVDRCLADLGYQRRELTQSEIAMLRSVPEQNRQELLNRLIEGENIVGS